MLEIILFKKFSKYLVIWQMKHFKIYLCNLNSKLAKLLKIGFKKLVHKLFNMVTVVKVAYVY